MISLGMSVLRLMRPLAGLRVSTSAKNGEMTGDAAPVGPTGVKAGIPALKLIFPLLFAKNVVWLLQKKFRVNPNDIGPLKPSSLRVPLTLAAFLPPVITNGVPIPPPILSV